MRSSVLALGVLCVAAVGSPVAAQEADSTDQVVYRGTFVGVEGHDAGGSFAIIRRGTNWYAKTLEDFTSEKVPDGHVYFSDEPDGIDDNALYLGVLHKREGVDEYAIPEGVDPASFKYFIVWCGRFDVGVAAGEMVIVEEGE